MCNWKIATQSKSFPVVYAAVLCSDGSLQVLQVIKYNLIYWRFANYIYVQEFLVIQLITTTFSCMLINYMYNYFFSRGFTQRISNIFKENIVHSAWH